MLKFLYLYFILLSLGVQVSAQNACTTLGQTPATAFPICGTSSFVQSSVPVCVNNNIYVNCPESSYPDSNPYWYSFTCFSSGSLQFMISPKNSGDDYDWEIFDITGRNLSDVYSQDPSVWQAIFVADNWSGVVGNTGTRASASSLSECASEGAPGPNGLYSSPPPFSKPPTIIKGHKYLLLISHFSGSDQSGYSLTFSGGTASITDTVQPKLQSAYVSCDAKSLTIVLNKKMTCGSLSPDGSDFSISGNAAAVISAASLNCNNGFDMDSLTLQFGAALPPGQYSIVAKNGSDGNTLLDNCGNNIPVGSALAFAVNVLMPTPLDSISPAGCSPNSFQLVFSKPIQCSSIAADGSDFQISGSTPVQIVGASGKCVNGVSSTISLQLSATIQTAGIYTITLVNGSDGNTIIDLCGMTTPAGQSVSLITADTVSAQINYQVDLGCVYDTVMFSNPGLNNINYWKWNYGDGFIGNTRTNSVLYNIFGVKNISLVVSNGVCSDSAAAQINLNNSIKSIFGTNLIICPEDKEVFTDSSIGNIVSWNWNFGDGSQSTLSNPPDHLYPKTEREALYMVRLIVTNDIGCSDTSSKQITKLQSCFIAVPSAFTPNGDGINDYLYPLNAYKADNLLFRVYNRYGQLVFETRDWTHKWDGKINGIPQSTGTYVWFLQYDDHDSGKHFFYKGTTVLIR